MLKVEIENNGVKSVEAEGNAPELVRDCMTVVGYIYGVIHDQSPESAEFFMEQVRMIALQDGFWEAALPQTETKAQ
jgi:hypothetical protein